MKKLLFTIDGFSYPHIGYTAGKRWNGWATPFFEIDEALKVMAEFNFERPDYEMTYDEETDTFSHYIDDDEIEEWKGKNYQTDDGIKHLYSIGAYSWVWEDVNAQDIYAVAQRVADTMWECDTYELRDQYDDVNDVVDIIAKQLQDLHTLKHIVKFLYGCNLSDYTYEEICEQFSKYLRV